MLLLSSLVLLIYSCGSDGGNLSLDSVQTQDSLLNIQTSRLMMIQNAIDINRKALEMPFRSSEVSDEGVPLTPEKNPLADLTEERMLAFKSGFSKVNEGFEVVKSEHETIIEEVKELQKLLANTRDELKGDALTAETKSGFALVPDQITSLASRIDALETKVKDVQKNAINVLMSEETLKPSASWLMVNSPLI